MVRYSGMYDIKVPGGQYLEVRMYCMKARFSLTGQATRDFCFLLITSFLTTVLYLCTVCMYVKYIYIYYSYMSMRYAKFDLFIIFEILAGKKCRYVPPPASGRLERKTQPRARSPFAELTFHGFEFFSSREILLQFS